MATPTQDRLVRKEVALTTIREIPRPKAHIGLTLVPFLEVESDDVIFDYTKGVNEGLTSARAEDAESELAQKDALFGGTGRAAVIDWAQKHHYTASDIQRYNELLVLQARDEGVNSVRLPSLVVEGGLAKQQRIFARDEGRRRRDLDNRLEWLVMTALSTGGLSYNDAKVKFTVDYGRPVGQHNQAPGGPLYNGTTHDPIGDFKDVVEFMDTTYGVKITRAVLSQKILNTFVNSDRFIARSTGIVVGGTPNVPIDPNYLGGGFGNAAAIAAVEEATGVTMIPYDGFYRSRTVGSTTFVNTRFTPENQIIFLPSDESMAEIEDEIGLGKMLTSPHPEGNWQPGFYEWEKSDSDPWGVDRGTGIKAFPIFPQMELTFTMNVLP